MNANIFEKANQIIRLCDAAYLGVIDEDGFPSVSTVSSIKADSIFEAWFTTGTDANKTKRLLKNNRASVCYQKDGSNITLVGEAEIVTCQDTKSGLWQDWFINHFPLGETDPTYCVIKFTTKRVSLWIDNESAAFTIAELLTIQSRCGLLCHGCTFKEPCHCGGCIETGGNPFHGACPVAACCQEKGYEHCGQCDVLPCEKLYQYSYLDGEHSDKPQGARVAVLKAWAERNKMQGC